MDPTGEFDNTPEIAERKEVGINVSGYSDAGYSKDKEGAREEINQDAFFIDKNTHSAVVCDGLSGGMDVSKDQPKKAAELAGREIISGLVGLKAEYSRHEIEGLKGELADIYEHASKSVVDAPEVNGAMTTAVGCRIVSIDGVPHAIIVNVGDSRAYLLRSNTLSQLTIDDSSVRTKIDDVETYKLLETDFGYVQTEADLQNVISKYPNVNNVANLYWRRNRLSRTIGYGEHDDNENYISPEIQIVPLQSGDRVLLVTDGVPDNNSNTEIRNMFLTPLEDPSRKLVEVSVENSIDTKRGYGRKEDNATAVVFEIENKAARDIQDSLQDLIGELHANRSPYQLKTMKLLVEVANNPNIDRETAEKVLEGFEESKREKAKLSTFDIYDQGTINAFYQGIESLRALIKEQSD